MGLDGLRRGCGRHHGQLVLLHHGQLLHHGYLLLVLAGGLRPGGALQAGEGAVLGEGGRGGVVGLVSHRWGGRLS